MNRNRHRCLPRRPRPLAAATTTAAAVAALLCIAGPTRAAGTVALADRTSVNYLYYFGGYAISGDEGEDGAPAPIPGGPWEGVTVTGLAGPTLAIAGSDYAPIQYLQATGFLAETWSQSQTFDLANVAGGAALHVQGHADIDQTSQVCAPSVPCGLATELHRSTNTLAVEFTLSAATSYTFSGATSGGQWLDILVWNVPAQGWAPVVSGPFLTKDTSFSLTGTLQSGLYMLRNNPYIFNGGGTDDVHNAWDGTLLLQGATVAVPEPPAALLWAAGLGSVLLLRRRGRER